ncbi:centrosomal protein of 70 kDa isoform X2 [Amia ocellicauda]|uniref:centrosomal protein of 70 kDa isoform X2 n=1 Tax=Amia ocellicauda TaxID=2972642 RepID=UPI003464A3DE
MSYLSSGLERGNEQQEQADWEAVNRLLRHHGFKPIHFADPMENRNLADLVLLEKKSASEIQLVLQSVLKDTERRQVLIQELIQSNNQLKDEAQQQQARAARQSQRAAELDAILSGVKAKVQQLEDDYIAKAAQQQTRMKQLQQEKRDAQKRYQLLEQKLGEEREVISQLQKKLYFTVKEEEERVRRQNNVFLQIRKRAAKPHSPLDQQILDVIDVYEAQIHDLRSEIRTHSAEPVEGNPEHLQCGRETERKHALDATPHYKALLESYQSQLKETKAQKEELRRSIQSLRQELESRPTAKEFKSYQQQLKRMDRISRQNNVKSVVEDGADAGHGTGVEDIGGMQDSLCRSYLKNVCKELEVQNLNDLVTVAKLRTQQADSVPRLTKILNAIKSILNNPRAPLLLYKQKPYPESKGKEEYEHLLPTIDLWAEQLISLKDLHGALRTLLLRMVPWHSAGARSSSEGVRVEELLLMADMLLEETAKNDKEVRSPTRSTLQAMVSHFQKLFDVNSISGVYPRMNEVYTKLGEMTNAMRNLRDILVLDDGAPPSAVVNKVGKLCCSVSDDAGPHLQRLLETHDIDSIINKLEEHDEFFPAFHSLVLELIQILDVNHLEEIVPAVRSLSDR